MGERTPTLPKAEHRSVLWVEFPLGARREPLPQARLEEPVCVGAAGFESDNSPCVDRSTKFGPHFTWDEHRVEVRNG